jgi:hypothetical protein
MSPRDKVKVGVSAAMLLAGGALLVSWLMPARAEAGASVTCWLCTDASCGKEFTEDVADLARMRRDHPDANPPCPACGKATTVRAIPCPHCGKYLRPIGHGFIPKTCPKCQKETASDGPRPAESSPPAQQPSSMPAPQGATPGAPQSNK